MRAESERAGVLRFSGCVGVAEVLPGLGKAISAVPSGLEVLEINAFPGLKAWAIVGCLFETCQKVRCAHLTKAARTKPFFASRQKRKTGQKARSVLIQSLEIKLLAHHHRCPSNLPHPETEWKFCSARAESNPKAPRARNPRH